VPDAMSAGDRVTLSASPAVVPVMNPLAAARPVAPVSSRRLFPDFGGSFRALGRSRQTAGER